MTALGKGETGARFAGTGGRAQRPLRWPLLLVLVAPSFYFFFCFPPLWRDSDGFFQLASGINELTIIHWPPLYCLGARVFLLLGALVESAVHGGLGHFHWSFGKPTFTDAGVYALLVAQHLILVGALLAAVTTLTRVFWLRVALAAGFALNAPLYAFSHCVGTEALSNAFTLLVFAAAVRLFQELNFSSYRRYALAQGGANLTRQINAVLAGLLPLALGMAATVHLVSDFKGADPRLASRLFRRTVVSALVAAATIAATESFIRGLCWIKHLPYRSRIGYTFMWRLNYLEALEPGQRDQTVRRIGARLHDPITVAALAGAVRDLDQNPHWNTDRLYYGISNALRESGISRQQTLNLETDQRLNRLAKAFLFPPEPALRAAVVHDFVAGLRFTPANMSGVPFRATDWLQARLAVPSFAPIRQLITFRGPPGLLEEEWRAKPYFHLWAWLPVWALGLTDLLCGILVCWKAKGREPNPGYLSISTAGTGLILYFVNCWLTFLGDRFLLPLEILFWCGISLAITALVESCRRTLPDRADARDRQKRRNLEE